MDRMKDYRQLIKELPSTTLVCAFGDFDPPTTAHELLVKTVNRLSEQKNTDHVIYASTKDSLIQEEKKEQYLKLMFPKTKFKSVNESKINNLLEELGKKYKKIVIVTGSEQVDKLKKLVKENTSIQIIAITEKNPDVNFAKMKQLATKGLYEQFKKKLPSNIRELDGRRLMNDVRHGLGLDPVKENLILVKDKLREQYFRGEIFNEGDSVESNGELYTIFKRGSNHLLLKEQSGNLVSKWIKDVKPKEEKEMKEGVIQPNGTDKLEVSTSDTGAKQDITKPTGKTKGFLTFYNYNTKDPVKEGTDPVAKERMKAQLTLKHAKEKESLAAKHTQEKENLQTEETLDELSTDLLARYKTAAGASAKVADASGNYTKGDKRFKGINKATTKQFDNDLKKHDQLKEEHIVHVDDGSNYGDKPHDKDVEHVMAGAKKHNGEFDGHSDKGAFFKFKSQSDARNFADHVKRAPHKSVHADLHEETELEESYEQAEKHLGLADKAQRKKDMFSHHMHMADYHGSLADWHDSKGRSSASDRHLGKAADHEETAHAIKNKSIEEESKKKPVCPVCGKHECECGEQRPGIGTETSMSKDPFFKEDITEEEIDEIVNSVTDEDIEDLYEEDELVLVYDDDGEEIPPLQEESKYDLMEVLSRTERIRGKMRLRKTSAKRGRSTKIALKRFSNSTTINKRARRLAIKLMKKRMLRGRDPTKVSVGEKERIERAMEKRKDIIGRVAQKLVSRVRKVEKARMSHGKVTKGSTPNVF